MLEKNDPGPPPSADNQFLRVFAGGAELDPALLERLCENHRVYLMFVVARSGSTWLTELARNTGRLGIPQEWLNFDFCEKNNWNLGCPPPSAFGVNEVNAYIEAFAQHSRSENGVVGLQIDWIHVKWLCELGASRINWNEKLAATFYLRRRDVIGQAISLYRSCASGRFHSYQSSPEQLVRFREVPYDRASIEGFLSVLLDCETEFEGLFRRMNIRPARFFYEDLVSEPGAILNAMTSALGDAPCGIVTSNEITKISDTRNADWASRLTDETSSVLPHTLSRRPPL